MTRFEGRLLYPIHVVAALPSAHRLARRRLLEIAELEDEPLLLPQRGFGSREWFDIACDIAHIRPRVLLESAAPHTLVALAATDYAIAILPSNVRVPPERVRAIPLVHRGASIGRWTHIAWDPQRFLAPYAEHFVTELVTLCQRRLPRPRDSSSARRLCRSQESSRLDPLSTASTFSSTVESRPAGLGSLGTLSWSFPVSPKLTRLPQIFLASRSPLAKQYLARTLADFQPIRRPGRPALRLQNANRAMPLRSAPWRR